MLLTIEKVFILKSVSIFARIPEEALIDAAAVVEEVECSAGTVVVRKGEMGTSMYVVVEGRVRVQDEATVLGEMTAGELFGELSALDPKPRSATVTAVEDAYLFKMSQQSIYELMAQHSELAQGIIQVLCQRIRDCPKFMRPPEPAYAEGAPPA